MQTQQKNKQIKHSPPQDKTEAENHGEPFLVFHVDICQPLSFAEEIGFNLLKGLANQSIAAIKSEYIDLLGEHSIKKLAVKNNNSEISVWAEIAQDDEESETKLIKAEAIINAKYYHKGFYIDTMIVEDTDFLPIPSQYTELIKNK